MLPGGKMKETGLDHWNSPNTGATNESGFTALPAGYKYDLSGNYGELGYIGHFWTSTWCTFEFYGDSACRMIVRNDDSILSLGGMYFPMGQSIRCLKD